MHFGAIWIPDACYVILAILIISWKFFFIVFFNIFSVQNFRTIDLRRSQLGFLRAWLLLAFILIVIFRHFRDSMLQRGQKVPGDSELLLIIVRINPGWNLISNHRWVLYSTKHGSRIQWNLPASVID